MSASTPNYQDRLARINRTCYRIGISAMLVYGAGVTTSISLGLSFLEALSLCTLFFQWLAIGYATILVARMFFRMDFKSDVSIELAQKSIDALDKLEEEIKPLVRDADRVVHKVESMVDRAEGIPDEIKDGVAEMRKDMALIRERIAKETEPIALKRRETPPVPPVPARPPAGDGESK